MKTSSTFVFILAICAVMAFGAPTAALEMTTSPPATIYQQTEANPCFYGGNNCQVPQGWESIAAVTAPGTSYTGPPQTYLFSVPLYNSIINTGAFFIGVDVNDTNNAQTLNYLSVDFSFVGDPAVGAPVEYEYVGSTGNLPNSANGVGFSDFIIGIGLVGDQNLPTPILIPQGATGVTFTLQLSGLNDGADRFFIIPNQQGDTTVPEPATVALLGSALVGLGIARKSWRNAA